MGHGFALPHPRDPSVSGFELEYRHLCMFERPVDFDALFGLIESRETSHSTASARRDGESFERAGSEVNPTVA